MNPEDTMGMMAGQPKELDLEQRVADLEARISTLEEEHRKLVGSAGGETPSNV